MNSIYFYLDGVIKRGFRMDLNETQEQICRKVEWCTICDDDNCNSMSKKSNAVGILASYLLIIIFSVFNVPR